MFSKINVFVIISGLVLGAMSAPAWAEWTDCPSPYNGLDCSVDSSNVCEHISSPSDVIKCAGTTYDDVIYLVVEDNNLWAYGTLKVGEENEESFCCDSAELGSTIYPAEIDTYDGSDVICMRDSDLSVGGFTICEDISGSGNEAYPAAADIDAGGGNDYVSTSPVGTHADTVDAGDGTNYVLTWGGSDTITGGDNSDYLYGGDGEDTIDGGDGDDEIWGDSAADTIEGGDGADVIHGGGGDDAIIGDCDTCGTYGDTIYGDGGDDKIKGWLGDDVIYGGTGNDNICGQDGDDSLYGNDDDDCLCGGDMDYNTNDDGYDDTMSGDLGSDDCYYWVTGETDTYAYCTGSLSEDCGCSCDP